MSTERRRRSWLALALPGVLLAVSVFDDAVFGAALVAAGVAAGTWGVLGAAAGFVGLSVAMAAGAAWAVRVEPIRLSPRNEERLQRLRSRRLGRSLLPRSGSTFVTAVVAAVFGSVVPVLVAAAGAPGRVHVPHGLVVLSGVAYGVAFASGYGLLGVVAGAMA